MSGEYARQSSQNSEATTIDDDDDMECSDDDYEEDYPFEFDDEFEDDCKNDDPELFDCEQLQLTDAEKLVNVEIEDLCTKLKVSPSFAKMILFVHSWNKEKIIEDHKKDPTTFLIDSHLVSRRKHENMIGAKPMCSVCAMNYPRDSLLGVTCGHKFCRDCWDMHCKIQIENGVTTGIECMAKECVVLVTEDFVCSVLSDPKLRDKYSKFSFNDIIKSHPRLKFCPGADCPVIIQAKEVKAKKVECKTCGTCFCFKCGIAYHAPTDCDVIKKWLTKCEDDSETANYISAHTKDCPKCHVCIEKNGGCNHMQCPECKFDFCWMCLGDWKHHGSEYYECSKYKENPNIANETAGVQAREALNKYLFYFARWNNHSKSLMLEEQTIAKIKARTDEKVMMKKGTWIDWQYLLDAAALLRKCRYTLQYTYPYAYYMEKTIKSTDNTEISRDLFEFQQATLEREVENLSWKVERAELNDESSIQNQMQVAEHSRQTLLKKFLEK